MLRVFLLLVLFLCLPATASAQALPTVAAEADRYVAEIAAAYGGASDPVESRMSRLDGEQAAAQRDWPAAVVAFERAIAFGADDFATWLALSKALPYVDRTPNAAAAAYLAFLGTDQASERADALSSLGGLLERLDRVREAQAAYEASLGFAWNDQVSHRIQFLSELAAFRVVNAYADTGADQPRVCVQFRGSLQETAAVRYEDYVKITPAVAHTFDVADDVLCIDGVEFGVTYEVAILRGLQSAAGDKLPSIENLAVTVGDRAPSVGFQGSTYVLPKTVDPGVPLISVNVDSAQLRLFRINDRGLVQQLHDGQFLRALDGYSQQRIADDYGEEIWSGRIDIAVERNRRVVTSVPIAELLPETAPGVYILTAQSTSEEVEDWGLRATQWLVVSDIGLTVMRGADGINLFARSLESGKPLPDVDVRLYARNNEELGRSATDGDGQTTFDPGLLRGEAGRAATAVMAFTGEGDFAFLDLGRPAFDLSDRGVGGRVAPGPTDLFLYTDRGVYRPGETVQLVGLLRDAAGRALSDLPLTVKAVRPDGVEAQQAVLASPGLGGYHLSLPVSATARTGSWRIDGYLDPAGPAIGSVSFLVEEVVPARIEVALDSDIDDLQPGGAASVMVDARYLYGAPAASLQVKAELVLERDDDPFPMHAGYRFSLADEPVEAIRQTFNDLQTDAGGKARLDIAIELLPETPQPLQALLRVEVYEFGGRPVTKTLKLPVRHLPVALGLKPLFENDSVPERSEAAFEVLAVGSDGQPKAVAGLGYRFIREEWDYQWFYRGGNWDYEVVVRDRPLQSGQIEMDSSLVGQVAALVDWGRFRLEIYDPTSGAATSVRFSAGWSAAPGIGDTPDRLQIAADKVSYAGGEHAKVLITPPFAGQVVVAVATDRVIETRSFQANPDGIAIEVEVDAKWGAGAYVLATAFRPGEAEGARGPGRAIGVAWLGVDASPRTLRVEFDLPEAVEPRQRIDVPVHVDGLAPGETAYMTLAAVDEGVLQLTEFASPEPQEHFFGKRRLGVELRDLYGQLIDANAGRRGKIRQGGDESALGRRGAPPPTIELVALFSGIVRLDSGGRATVALDLPDYNGRLRLMAVAFAADKVGGGEAALVVRDRVVTLVAMPRFLATGDRSQFAVALQNVTGPANQYEIDVAADGVVEFAGPARATFDLVVGASRTLQVDMIAKSAGEGRISASITGPDGYRLERQFRIGVRAPQLPVVERIAKRLQPGEGLKVSGEAIAKFLPGTGEVLASVSPRPNLDVPGLLRSLDRYPYGCLEQTTSRALPLLYVGEIAKLWGADGEGPALQARLQDAVSRILEMQRWDGSFGAWGPDNGAEPWLTAYAMDFLARARQQRLTVPETAFRQGIAWLADHSQSYREDDASALSSRAYAFLVLAEVGVGDISALRYLHDNYSRRMPTALAAAQLGAALAMHGDQARAAESFKVALGRVDRQRRQLRDFGTPLRDLAAVVALMAESRLAGHDPASLLERLAAMQANARYLSTQEQSWLLMAAHATATGSTPMMLAVNDVVTEPRSTAFNLRPSPAELATGITLRNAGDGTIWGSQTSIGVPQWDQPAISAGFSIERRYYNLVGEEMATDQVRQSDVLVVVIGGKSRDEENHQALVVDLLPAGFEVENVRLAHSRTAEKLTWLPELSTTQYIELLDDRFVASLELGSETGTFTIAYIVRAVTPGTYRLPAAEVEDMYQPGLRARTAIGTLTIAPYR